MNHDDLSDLRPLAHPADVEFRSALAVLLQRLLVDPGALFNPLYVGPLRDPELLTEEVQRLATETGLRMLSVNEVGGRDAAQTGIALLSERDATRIAKYGGRPGGSVQVVIWGRQPAAELSTLLQEWVEGGLQFDPAVDGQAHEPRPIAEAVHRLATGSGGPRALVWVGAPAGDEGMIAEVRLRWALETNAGVADHAVPAEEGVLEGVSGCVILRLSGAAGPEGARRAWSQARELIGRGVTVVLSTDPVGEAALRLLGPIEGPGPAEAEWMREPSVPRAREEVSWPALATMLIGRPEVRRRRPGIMQIPLDETPLIEVLRGAAKWQQAGTFVIYESGRLGYIQVSNGEIRGARRVQERQEAGTAAETIARLRDIARWPHARAYFVPRDPETDAGSWGTGCRLPLDTVAFDLATIGRGSSGFASVEQSPGEVAAALALWGLVPEAVAVLREPTHRGEMSARSHFLLGHFRTSEPPAQAVESFREAVHRLVDRGERDGGRALALDAGLNALLIEVRADLRTPGSAWRVVAAAGLAEPAALADAPDRALIVLELAARAEVAGAVERLARWLIDRGAGGELPGLLLRRYAPVAVAPPAPPPPPAAVPSPVPAEPAVLAGVGGAR